MLRMSTPFSSFEQLLLSIRSTLIKSAIKRLQIDSINEKIPFYLEKKIERENLLKGFQRDSIIEKIKTDAMYASFFIKDPIKQNVAENLQLELMKIVNPSVEKLPARGVSAMYISPCGIVSKTKSSKSFDFIDKTSNAFYVCKYTHENGGAQDLQYMEIKQYVCCINRCTDLTLKFILLLDGNYWKNKLETIRETIVNENCIVIQSKI